MSIRKIALVVSTVSIPFLLSGCPAFQKINLGDDQMVFTDAEKRGISRHATDPIGIGVNITRSITCAEPSPDIAKATEKALSAALSVKGKGEASLSSSQAEAIASLVERTASIQLLRDYMYRACESVANGMMSSTDYSLLMSRTNKAMITLMIGETAGGAFGRRGAAIGGSTSSSSNSVLSGLVEDFDEAIVKLKTIDANLGTAKTELESKKQELSLFDAREGEKKDEDRTEIVKKIDALALKVSQLEENKTTALNAVQSRYSSNISTAAEITKVEGVGQITPQTSAEIASILAQMHEIFIRDSLADEYVSACISDMGTRFVDQDTAILPTKDNQTASIVGVTDSQGNTEQIVGRRVRVGKTVLSTHCERHLDGFLNQTEANRAAHIRRVDDLNQVRFAALLIQGCKSVSAEDQEACLERGGPGQGSKKSIGGTSSLGYEDLVIGKNELVVAKEKLTKARAALVSLSITTAVDINKRTSIVSSIDNSLLEISAIEHGSCCGKGSTAVMLASLITSIETYFQDAALSSSSTPAQISSLENTKSTLRAMANARNGEISEVMGSAESALMRAGTFISKHK